MLSLGCCRTCPSLPLGIHKLRWGGNGGGGTTHGPSSELWTAGCFSVQVSRSGQRLMVSGIWCSRKVRVSPLLLVPHRLQAISLESGIFSCVFPAVDWVLEARDLWFSIQHLLWQQRNIRTGVRLLVRPAGCPPTLQIPSHNAMKFPDPVFCPYSFQTLATLAPQALIPTSSYCPAWLREEARHALGGGGSGGPFHRLLRISRSVAGWACLLGLWRRDSHLS